MNSDALLARFRLETRDEASPPLWSDVEIYSYMDEAHMMFCRLTGGVSDASSGVTKLRGKAGQGFAALSSRILKLRAAFDVNNQALKILNFEDLEASPSFGSEIYDQRTGPVTALVVGMEPNKVRLIPVPVADTTFNMIVYRMPLDDISQAGQDFEIDDQHHLSLLFWMQHLAHLKTDAETYDRGRSDQYKADFEAYCMQAKQEKGQREHKHRLMQFSW